MSSISLQTWQTLLTLPDLVAGAEAATPHDVAAIARLRKHHSLELVHAAFELAEARRKARAKFPARAATLVADPQGVEMATSAAAAAHKAARFARLLSGEPVADLCCGIGGDAMALTAAGIPTLAVDRDETRAWMAGVNAGCGARAADALDPSIPPTPFHIDPSRRSADNTRRLFRLADHEPGPAALLELVQVRCDGAVKLGPAVDAEDLPFDLEGELEYISERGRLTQAVLWLGRLREHPRSATILPEGLSVSGEPAESAAAPIGDLARYLLAADPSVERAKLLPTLCERLGAPMLHPGLGLLTTDAPVDTPWATRFEVLARMPWNQKRVAAHLAGLNAGIVEVKTRGGVIDPDQVQRDLRGRGDEPFTVFVLRFDRAIEAIVTRRLTTRPDRAPGASPGCRGSKP